MKIINFALQDTKLCKMEPYPRLYLWRYKFLTRLLNYLIRKCHATTEVEYTTTSRIEINLEKADAILRKIYLEQVRHNRPIKCFVVGYDFYCEFVKGAELHTMVHCNVSTPSFMGITIVLHPTIYGALALEFAPN